MTGTGKKEIICCWQKAQQSDEILTAGTKEEIMTEPVRASDLPIAIEVEAGKSYFWCACGRSKKQPFCDGSHKDTEFVPLKYQADESKKVFFCGCKQTGNQPLCDGSHKG